MRLIGSGEVQGLTGLSADQLREWTGRRGLIRADRPAQGKGTQARYSWQTVLVLRLALVLKQRFHLELQAHRELLAELQRLFHGKSFPILWDNILLFRGGSSVALIRLSGMTLELDEPAITIPLASHLQPLMVGFGLPSPMQQLPLFRAVGVK